MSTFVRIPREPESMQTSLIAPRELPLVLLAHLRLVILLPLLLFAVGLAKIVYGPPKYVAESRVRPGSSDGGMSRFAGLAAQFGVALPGGSAGDPMKLYAELLTSQRV